jgi:hypothetical protein
VLRIFALLLALVSVACMCMAIIGMVTGRSSDRAGLAWRLAAVVCFAAAVALNVAAH